MLDVGCGMVFSLIKRECRGGKPGVLLLVWEVWQVLRLRVLHKAARRFAQDDSSVVVQALQRLS